jgi:cell division protein FtsA
VRLGVPQSITGLVDVVRNPIYATGVGLLLFGYQNRSRRHFDADMGRGIRGVWERMKSWFQGNF